MLTATANPTADLFRATWQKHAAKQIVRASGSSLSAAKYWLAAKFCPSSDTLLRMAAENIELRRELIRRLENYNDADTNMASRSGDVAAPMGCERGAAGGSDRPAETDQADAVRVTK